MKKKVLLLVEDNPVDEALTLRVLDRHGLANEIVVARDGVEALDFLFCREAYKDREPDLPTVMLLDLKLPKVDGFEVLQQVRSDERTRLLPVVILTSSKEQVDVLKSYDMGANSYVQKPVEFEQFSNAVHQLGLYWLIINEPLPK